MLDDCKSRGIFLTFVTKCLCGDLTVTKDLNNLGILSFGDSRIENLKNICKLKAERILLRLPLISEVEDVVKYSHISLNSEIKVIEQLSQAARKQHKIHKIILMIDLGDLREGIYAENEIFATTKKILSLSHIKLWGIGTNLSCFGAVIPEISHMEKLIKIRKTLETKFQIEIPLISGGNSSIIHLIDNNSLPKEINHIRIGSGILFGIEQSFFTKMPGFFQDTFILNVEIIELKTKPSIPIGNIGLDAFMQKPHFIDRGMRKRAICAVGKQDVDFKHLEPLDPSIIILGGSSDHLILDVSDSDKKYSIGSIVQFQLKYGGILSCFTSRYVKKNYLH